MINTIIGTVLSNTGDEQFMAKIQEFEFYPDKAMAEESAYAVYLRKYPEEVNPRKNAKVSPWYAVIEIGNIDLGQPLTKNIFIVWYGRMSNQKCLMLMSVLFGKKRPRF